MFIVYGLYSMSVSLGFLSFASIIMMIYERDPDWLITAILTFASCWMSFIIADYVATKSTVDAYCLNGATEMVSYTTDENLLIYYDTANNKHLLPIFDEFVIVEGKCQS